MKPLDSKFEFGMDPLELVPELNDIFFEIQTIFEKRNIDKAQAVLILSQCIGAIAAEIILANKKDPLKYEDCPGYMGAKPGGPCPCYLTRKCSGCGAGPGKICKSCRECQSCYNPFSVEESGEI